MKFHPHMWITMTVGFGGWTSPEVVPVWGQPYHAMG